MKTFALLLTTICFAMHTQSQMLVTNTAINKKWWKEAIVYQIYPRSFKDSDGDGIGDLKGIISKLDYIKSLGVDVVWLNPIYASPNDDNGYDISNYREIMKDFGTMEDFDALLKGMHQRKIKLVMDLVVNHSSDEHEWFKQSRSSRTNPYRDYYHWWPAERGKPNHRWSYFDVNQDAWMYDEKTNSYYLHYFSQKQPDLNWENPKLRQEVYDIMRFWFKKGIDGFRMDVISYISKDTSFPPIPDKYDGRYWQYYGEGPHVHDYLKEMNTEVLSKYNVMSVAEGAGVTHQEALKFVDEDRKELNMLFHFEAMDLGLLPNQFKQVDPAGLNLVEFKNVFSKWDKLFETKGWGTIFLANHDQPRMVSRWGNDAPEFREPSSKMLTTFLFTMRSTPHYLAGDEIGMTNIYFDKIEDYNDIEVKNKYQQLVKNQGDLHYFLEAMKKMSRDNSRTPFHWNTDANGGFTTGTPWLKVNPNYKTINVTASEADPNSVLSYFKQLVQIRKANPVLVYGQYTLVDAANPNIYAYTRTLGNKKALILLNFKNVKASINESIDLTTAKLILNNYATNVNVQNIKNAKDIELLPYQSLIFFL